MLSLEKLRKPLTRAESMTRIVELLTSLGFDTTGWQDGRIQKTLLVIFAIMHSDLTEVVKALAEFGSNRYATGPALDEYSRSRFANERVQAVRTRGPIKLTSTASIPYTIEPGQLIAATDAGVMFRNVTGGTLSAGSVNAPATLTLTWDALIAGAQGNVPLNAVRRLTTPLAGVSVANDTGSPWYTTAGAHEESDALLKQRNTTKWADLTVELVAESYVSIALSNGAKKVIVDDTNPRGPGTVDVYSAGETAPLGNAEMAAIQLAFSRRAFQTDAAWTHPWPNSTSRVANRHPSPQGLTLTATLYHDPNVPGATIQQRARAALLEFVRVTPIGGWTYGGSLEHVVTREDVVDRLKDVEGMRTVVTNFATLSMGALALLVEGTWTLTPIAASS